VLTLKVVVLDAEFNSLSNGATFKGGHRTKLGGFDRNTGFFTLLCYYILPIFASTLVLTLKVVVLDAEFNSLSNGVTFNKGHRLKSGSYGEKLDFWPPFYSEIFSFLSRFVQQLVLTLKMVVLDAEFNSLSNGTRFSRDHW
jgi:hypothetical protein